MPIPPPFTTKGLKWNAKPATIDDRHEAPKHIAGKIGKNGCYILIPKETT